MSEERRKEGRVSLLITGCKDRLRWYSGLVGEEVPFLGDAGYGEYRSRQPAGYVNFVQYEDAEVVCDCDAWKNRNEVSASPACPACGEPEAKGHHPSNCIANLRTELDQLRRLALDFKPASEAPESGDSLDAYLLINPCDGFHIAYGHFFEDGSFDGFYPFGGVEEYGKDFYVAWALLPDPVSLARKFV